MAQLPGLALQQRASDGSGVARVGAALKPRGYVIWRGRSLLNGDPIVAIALTHSNNRKTGDMAQTYILREDLDPVTSAKTGADIAICGMCPQRPFLKGKCYVTLIRGPLGVYKAFKAGKYPLMAPGMVGQLLVNRHVRLGAYGDPAAVPASVWESLTRFAAGWTGYTHQWQVPMDAEHLERINALCMASVDSPEQALEAKGQGLRYFRSRLASEPKLPGEFICPASNEAGKAKTCSQCGACDGSARPARASPVIILHGVRAPRLTAALQ